MYQKILVPLDGSLFSESVLGHAREIAAGCGVPQLVLLTAIEPLVETYRIGDDLLKKMYVDARATAQKYLDNLAEKLKVEGLNAQPLVVEGEPAEVILDYAAKNKVDLIIMSGHGRSGVTRWVLGSVADRVVRNSPAPVLIAPPPVQVRGKKSR